MLTFRAQNVRSFRDEFELSLISTRLAEDEIVRSVTWREGGRPIGILPAAGVFGANASGKSNVLKAMDDMRGQVLHSFRTGNPIGGIPRRPFLLDLPARGEPSRFEVDVILAGVRQAGLFANCSARMPSTCRPPPQPITQCCSRFTPGSPATCVSPKRTVANSGKR